MNKKDYIRTLEKQLQGLPEDEIQDILLEVETHFVGAIKNNRTEKEIIKALGSPTLMAKSIMLEYDINQKNDFVSLKDNLNIGLRILAVGFKNIILLPLFMSVGLIVLSFYLVIFAFYLTSAMLVLSPIIKLIAPVLISHDPLPLYSLPFIGLFGFILTKKLHSKLGLVSKALYKYLLKYIKVDIKRLSF
ncbi:MAG: DUF1700 domain-containing protein [Clostridiales bacterium]|nr:DUF1700 domain-containing protein [Clostridiales bacterium]